MKGKLVHHDKSWYVEYETIGVKERIIKELPLHPDDVNDIMEIGKIFDNLESRITKSPEIEFEIIENIKMSGIEKYAKMK